MRITVYSTDHCPRCEGVKHRLKNRHKLIHGTDFHEVNVSHDAQANAYVKSLGYQTAPVVLLTDKDGVIVQQFNGFNPAAVDTMVTRWRAATERLDQAA